MSVHRKDILWKGVLEWVCEDLIRFVYPSASRIFDFGRGFGFLEKEMNEIDPQPENKMDVRFVDKLVRVFKKGGEDEWILIHIEVQGRTNARDRDLFSERMFRYFYRCFDKYHKPIAAIALFVGPDGKLLPRKYEYRFLKTELTYKYTPLCLLDYSDKKLEKSKNPFALIMRIAKEALLTGKDVDEKLLAGKLSLFRKLIERGALHKKKFRAIFTFLSNYVPFKDPTMEDIFRDEIEKITQIPNTMDIFEAVQKFREEDAYFLGSKDTSVKLIARLLAKTDHTPAEIADIANVSLETVENVKAAAMDLETDDSDYDIAKTELKEQ